MDQFGQCIFNNLVLDKPQSRFNPTSDNSSFVTMIGFKDSRIQIFGRSICDEFTETRVMRLHDLGIQEVEEDAFWNCRELTQLTFYSGNFLKTLEGELFNFNRKLTALDFEGNRLHTLSESLFNGLTELRDLHLQNNRLKKIERNTFYGLTNLKYLYLQFNHLLEFDGESITENNKNLAEVAYYGNPLACSRVAELNEGFRDARVDVFEQSVELPVYYEPVTYKNVSCLSERSWLAAYNKRNLLIMNEKLRNK